MGIGESRDLQVFSYDEAGYPIIGPEVTYTWSTTIGTITPVSSTTNPGSTTDGQSTATLTIPTSSPIVSGVVSVIASYGGVATVPRTFTINTVCTVDPKLYFGIGSVRDTGGTNWYSSTAELVETCHSEYTLYGGTGYMK